MTKLCVPIFNLAVLLQACAAIGATNMLQLKGAFEVSKTYVAAVAISPDSSRIAVGTGSDESLGGHGALKMYRVATQALEFELGPYESTVRAICFSEDGKSIVGGGYPVVIWDAASRRKQSTVKPRSSPLEIAYIPRNNQIVVAARGGKEVVVWDSLKGRKATSFGFAGTPAVLTSLSLSTNGGRLAVGGFDCTASVWETQSWKLLRTFGEKAEIPDASLVRLSPDGFVLFAKGYPVKPGILWKVQDGSSVRLQNDDSLTSDAEFSPDGTLLVTVGYPGIYLWEVASGKLLGKMRGDFASVAYSPDGTYIAVGSNKGTVYLYAITPR